MRHSADYRSFQRRFSQPVSWQVPKHPTFSTSGLTDNMTKLNIKNHERKKTLNNRARKLLKFAQTIPFNLVYGHFYDVQPVSRFGLFYGPWRPHRDTDFILIDTVTYVTTVRNMLTADSWPELGSRVNNDSSRLIQTTVNQCPPPHLSVLHTSSDGVAKAQHLDAVVTSISPVQVVMNPVVCQTVRVAEVVGDQHLVKTGNSRLKYHPVTQPAGIHHIRFRLLTFDSQYAISYWWSALWNYLPHATSV